MISELDYGMDPQGRLRFYGVYSANVLQNNDPLKKGRLQLQIFQPTGKAMTVWTPQCVGVLPQPNAPYGVFLSTSSQTISGTTTVNFSSSPLNANGGIELKSSSRIYVNEIGNYKVDFSGTFENLGQYSEVNMWLRKNGVDIPWSGAKSSLVGYMSDHTVSAYAHVAPAGGGTVTGNHTDMVVTHSGTIAKHNLKSSFIVDMVVGDYLEVVMSSSGSTTTMKAYAGVGPGIPSIITTVNLVGKYVPKPGTKVWVMFEAGDPEYPVWIGAVA